MASVAAGYLPILLFLIVVLGRWVPQIPMAALVAVMIMVSINTFQWASLRSLLTHDKTSSVVMLGTVISSSRPTTLPRVCCSG